MKVSLESIKNEINLHGKKSVLKTSALLGLRLS